jgi:hypothetical protein
VNHVISPETKISKVLNPVDVNNGQLELLGNRLDQICYPLRANSQWRKNPKMKRIYGVRNYDIGPRSDQLLNPIPELRAQLWQFFFPSQKVV